jgi:hypothetical protein
MIERMASKTGREQVMRDAWIGDAVLGLYARLKILREDGAVDGEKYGRMTSNQFLSGVGEPSEVEAAIGRAYMDGGMEAGFGWIEGRLMPLYEKQEAKRERRG